MSTTRFGRMTVLTLDLDESKAFYEQAFDFATLFDGEVAPGWRTVHVGPGDVHDAGIWLLRAEGSAVERVGSQTAGEPAMVLYVDDLDSALSRLDALGHRPSREAAGDDAGYRFAHVLDPSGNEIVLVQTP